MQRFLNKIALLCFITASSLAYGWWDSGHKSVAALAYSELTPEAKVAVDDIVEAFRKYHPSYKSFAGLSTWPDNLQAEEKAFIFAAMHFVTYPYEEEPFLSEEKREELFANRISHGAIESIEQAKAVLKNPKSSMLSKCWSLSYLCHVVADLHQPMHCCSRFTRQMPAGDKGGNLYPIAPIKGWRAKNLHQLWDSGVGLFVKISSKEAIESFVHKIKGDYPKSHLFAAEDLDTKVWCKESYDIAKNHAYTLAKRQRPSQEYVVISQSIVKERIALASYRLANTLNEIFVAKQDAQ